MTGIMTAAANLSLLGLKKMLVLDFCGSVTSIFQTEK
jgi:hypothetical protein